MPIKFLFILPTTLLRYGFKVIDLPWSVLKYITGLLAILK